GRGPEAAGAGVGHGGGVALDESPVDRLEPGEQPAHILAERFVAAVALLQLLGGLIGGHRDGRVFPDPGRAPHVGFGQAPVQRVDGLQRLHFGGHGDSPFSGSGSGSASRAASAARASSSSSSAASGTRPTVKARRSKTGKSRAPSRRSRSRNAINSNDGI